MYAQFSDRWIDMIGGSISVVSSASVLLGGEVILSELPILSGSLTKSTDGRQITQTLNIEVVDESGELQAGPTAPLMPLGQQILLRAGLADKAINPTSSEMLPMGIFGIDSPESDSDVPWKLYPNGKWVPTGGVLSVSAADPLAQVGREDFVTPERPALSATVRTETERLLVDRLSVAEVWADGVVDSTAVPRSVTYDDSRLTALLNLAQMAGGVAWANRDGAYELLKQGRLAEGVWSLEVADPDDGETRGAMVTFKPRSTRDDLHNAVIITSEDGLGNPLQGIKYEETGPLRWGGPFGKVPLREENRLATSNAKCQTFAEQRYAQIIDGRSITVRVSCLPNFALDPLDTIALKVPNRTILGLITAITYPLGQALMEMDVSIPFTDWVVA